MVKVEAEERIRQAVSCGWRKKWEERRKGGYQSGGLDVVRKSRRGEGTFNCSKGVGAELECCRGSVEV